MNLIHLDSGEQLITVDDYAAYKQKKLTSIQEMLSGCGFRPVLFMGCGITRRYFGAPSWMELLREISTIVGVDADRFNYLNQKANGNPAQLGSILVDVVHEWAWSSGRNKFPTEYFEADVDRSIFLKFLCAEHLKNFAKKSDDDWVVKEVELLKAVDPYAIITTNFDTFLESIFPDFELIVGEKIIPMSASIIGECYKIHGSVSDPMSMVLTQQDYDRFGRKRKYITSKIMTYFAENPVFILGYGLGDANVNAIISDLGEALLERGGFLENVYYIEWVSDVLQLKGLKDEHVVPIASKCNSHI